MPEDQETVVTRRRSRRQEIAVTTEPTFIEATPPALSSATPQAATGDAAITSGSAENTRTNRRSTRLTARISKGSSEGVPMTNTTNESAQDSTAMLGIQHENDTTTGATAPRRRATRSTTAKATKADASIASTNDEQAAQPVRRGPRVSRPRSGQVTEQDNVAQSASEEVMTIATSDSSTSKAPKATRTRRTANMNADAEVTLPEVNNLLPFRAAESTQETQTTSPAQSTQPSSSAVKPYRPAARNYRFGSNRQEQHEQPESVASATDTLAETATASARQHTEAATDTQASQGEHAERVEHTEHTRHPLRRNDWTDRSVQAGQNSEGAGVAPRPRRERIQPHIPGGGMPETQTGRQTERHVPTRAGAQQRQTGGSAGRANQSGASGQPGRYSPAPMAPGRGTAPYSPGSRNGEQQVPAEYDRYDSSPRSANRGQGGQYNQQNQQGQNVPYGGYLPYDPYGYEPRDQRPTQDRQERQTPGGRPLRGRGYPNQQGQSGGYDQRDQRYPRQPMRPTSPADYYRREQGLTNPRDNRTLPPGRGSLGSNTYERRGGTAGQGMGRGQMGNRPQRDQGYGAGGNGNSLYTANPGSNDRNDRYEQRNDRYNNYANGNQGQGANGVSGMRSSGSVMVLPTVDVTGILWQTGGSFGAGELLDGRTLLPVARVQADDIRRLGLRQGDMISGRAEENGNRRTLVSVERVNDQSPEEMFDRPFFDKLTASFPERRIHLEHGAQPISTRVIDLFAPLGFGSRALVVAPPKTGKTTLMREAAEAVLTNYPDAVVMAVLVGERPEEVTDLRARLEPRGGLVYAASFDEDTQRHAWLVQVAVERAKRVAESGRDAFMVLDSLTRLARAENLATRGQGRTLSGGIDAQALDTGRRAFGAARNLEEGGSVTILATCLVDTGSRQDDVVYEEFKGTGNMELHLSRELAQRRLFPAVDAVKSSTRREEMLLTAEELRASTALRRRLADLPPAQATQQLLSVMERTPSNAALLQAIEQSGWTGNTR